MNQLELSILEEVARRKYASFLFLQYCFAHKTSKYYLQKRIKKLLNKKLIGRHLGMEPLTQKADYIFFPTRKGAKEVMKYSQKALFASIDEIKTPTGGHLQCTHDVAANCWVPYLIQRDWQLFRYTASDMILEFYQSKVRELVRGKYFIPDCFWKVFRPERRERVFFWEIDNITETIDFIRDKKLKLYQNSHVSWSDSVLLWVVTNNNQRRLKQLLRESRHYLPKQAIILGAILPDIYSAKIASNVWIDERGNQNHLPV